MAITIRPPDLVAKISLLSTTEGGKSRPAVSGYRPMHDFGLPGMLNDAAHVYIGQESLAPGETALANIWLLAPEYQKNRLYPGFHFTVQEGSRVVGNGIIEEVLSASLQRGT